MAGTNKLFSENQIQENQPVILLLRPQLGENIGMCARAMLNMGLTELRLVQPRKPWPNEDAIKPSSGALPDHVHVEVFDDLEAASADLHLIWATTARPRDMLLSVQSPTEAMEEASSIQKKGKKTGIMFGREATGMSNDEIVFADKIITADLNPSFSSLNLAQAVLMIAWEWRKAAFESNPPILNHIKNMEEDTASKQEFLGFFEHLESELSDAGYYRNIEKKPIMIRNLRNIFERSKLSSLEIRTLRGVIASLTRRHEIDRKDRKKINGR